MLYLVIAAFLLFAMITWLLARPLRKNTTADQESEARYRQYALARDRVLRQLDAVEAQAGDGVLDSEVARDEVLRLETELVGILKQLDELEQPMVNNDNGESGRLKWYLSLAVFGLVIPLSSLIMYTSWQFDSLLKLAGMEPGVMAQPAVEVAPAQQFPPEVVAMVERLEQRLTDNPDDGEGWKRLGRSYAVMGRSSEARAAYQRAAELLPGDKDIPAALSSLSSVNTAPVATSENTQFPPQVLEMVAQLENKLRQNPEDGEGWKRLGRAYTVMKRYSEAVSAYTSAAELLPNDRSIEQALQQLSTIAMQGGKHVGTGEGPDTQSAHPPLPEGSLDTIIKLEKRVGENPADPVAWAELGRAYMGIGQGEDAIRALQKAHELAEENIMILAMYAEAVFESDPRDPQGRALSLYMKLNKLSPRHPDGLWFLGLAAYSEGNLGRTVELWNQLLQVLPAGSDGHASVRQALAKVELLLNKEK